MLWYDMVDPIMVNQPCRPLRDAFSKKRWWRGHLWSGEWGKSVVNSILYLPNRGCIFPPGEWCTSGSCSNLARSYLQVCALVTLVPHPGGLPMATKSCQKCPFFSGPQINDQTFARWSKAHFVSPTKFHSSTCSISWVWHSWNCSRRSFGQLTTILDT